MENNRAPPSSPSQANHSYCQHAAKLAVMDASCNLWSEFAHKSFAHYERSVADFQRERQEGISNQERLEMRQVIRYQLDKAQESRESFKFAVQERAMEELIWFVTSKPTSDAVRKREKELLDIVSQ